MPKQTRIVQFMFANDVASFQNPRLGLEKMTHCQEIVFQAEATKTVRDRHGAHYVSDGRTPWQWALDNGIKPRAYFLFTKPHDEAWFDAVHSQEDDIYWLRKKMIFELRRNPHWTRPSHIPNAPYLNMINPDARRFVTDIMLETGIKDWYLDEMHVNNHHRQPPDQVDGMLQMCDTLRAAGCNLMGNGAWHMDDPHEADWTYHGMDHFDGVQPEYSVGYHDGIPDPHTGHWWTLDESSMLRVQDDWLAANKEFWLLVRYRPGETPFRTYQDFAMHFIHLSLSHYVPQKYNYQSTNWLNDFTPWIVDDAVIPPPSPVVSLPVLQPMDIAVVVDGISKTLPGELRPT